MRSPTYCYVRMCRGAGRKVERVLLRDDFENACEPRAGEGYFCTAKVQAAEVISF